MGMFVATLAVAGGLLEDDRALPIITPTNMVDEQRCGEYAVRVYKTVDYGAFEIHRGESLLEQRYWKAFVVGCPVQEPGKAARHPMGTDLTGNGVPNMVIWSWSGGIHCCFNLALYEIGEQFRHIQTIDLQHTYEVCFTNLDDDAALELPIQDWTFAYWNAPFCGSPAPEVILKYIGGQYTPALGLMRQPSLRPDELMRRAQEVAVSEEWQADQMPSALWHQMLGLIYSGNMPQAWEFLDMAWPTGRPGKVQFLKDFKVQLRMSPYWKDIMKLDRRPAQSITTHRSRLPRSSTA